jgi:hypothetical protein
MPTPKSTTLGPVRILSVAIRGFMGIRDLSREVPPGGVVVAGKNGSGKTSFTTALSTVLTGRGVDQSAIHLSADKAEILLDLGHVTVAQTITRGKNGKVGGGLTVSSPDGFEKKAPRTFLNELLGASPVNPLDLWLETDAKKRRALILAAVPAPLTAATLKAWCAETPITSSWLATLLALDAPIASDDDELPGHGLEILAKVRRAVYERRKTANATSEAREGDASRQRARHLAAVQALGPGDTLTVAAAELALEQARDAWRRATEGNAAAEAFGKRVSAMQLKIAGMRGSVDLEANPLPVAPTDAEIAAAVSAREEARGAAARGADRVRELERLLADAKSVVVGLLDAVEQARAAEADLEARRVAAAAAVEKRATVLAQANDMEEALGEAPIRVDAQELAAIEANGKNAKAALARAKEAIALNVIRDEVDAAEALAATARTEATALGVVVKRLTDDAPVELFAASAGIPGLVVGEDDITLDGVSLDRLCGAEKLKLAFNIAARASTSRVLVIDGLEALDPEAYELFKEHAAREGFQLFGTRVAAGEQVFEDMVAAS